MKRMLMIDFKRGICNKRATIGSVLYILGGIGVMISMLDDTSNSIQIIGVVPIDIMGQVITSNVCLVMLPIACTLPSSGMMWEDITTKYMLLMIHRSSKRVYVGAKIIATAFSGGIVVLGSVIILYILAVLLFPLDVYEIELLLQYPMEYIVQILWQLIAVMLSSCMWSMVGSACTVKMKSKYLGYGAPIIVYYILTTFQERYYRSYVYLNPEKWITIIVGKSTICFLVVSIVCLITVFLYYFSLRKGHVDEC